MPAAMRKDKFKMKRTRNLKKKIKLLYFKFGDVCNELIHSHDATIPIKGGHYHYVYSTHHTLGRQTHILYLSFNRYGGHVCYPGRKAKNLKVIGRDTLFKKIVNVIQSNCLLLIELLKFRPHHILMVNNYALFPCFLLSRLAGASFTLSIHNDLNIGTKMLVAIEHWVLKNSDSIICHGPYLRWQAKQIIGTDKNIIEYNASTQDIREMPTRYLDRMRIFTKEDTRVITYIGRMESEKGILDLYEAFKRICHKKGAPVRLCLAGGGSQLQPLKKRIIDEGMAQKVFIPGLITREEVAGLVGQSWVVVTPTNTRFPEGRCMAAMEALALGTPLIAPSFGPFLFLVKNGINGLFFIPDSIEDLTQKLKQIMSPELRNKLAAGAQTGALKINHSLSYGDAVKKSLQ
jgi:glycosyltransferase involved in cell wall biosynthesis